MKIILTILSFITISLSSYAKYITVNNTPGEIAMFTDLQQAVDSASIGDTVFVKNSQQTYNINNSGIIYIRKPIVLLGEGYKNPIGNAFSNVTINTITLQYTNFSTIQTIIKGLYISEINGYNYGCEISDCLILGKLTLSNTFGSTNIHNCRIYGQVSINGANNTMNFFTVSNCLIGAYAKTASIVNSTFVTFQNNLIFGGLSGCSNLILKNNIFRTPSIGGSYDLSGTSISYTKNIVEPTGYISSSDNYSWNYNLFDMGSGSYDYYQGGNNNFYGRFLLSSNSIKTYLGTDGNEIGLYGGIYPWDKTKFDTGNIGLPVVTKLELNSTIIEKDQPLNVNFKAVKGKK